VVECGLTLKDIKITIAVLIAFISCLIWAPRAGAQEWPPIQAERLTVVAGDTLSALAHNYGTTVDAFQEANGLTDVSLIKVGQKLRIPADAHTWHVVQRGDTVSGIAGRYGVSVDLIAAANSMSNVNRIHVGEELLIPLGGVAVPRALPYPDGIPRSAYPILDGPLRSIAEAHGVPWTLLAALVWTESGFNVDARSPVGAMGLAQLMPATAAELGVDPSVPYENLYGGALYLSRQLDRFGSVELSLAAYNAGPGAVRRHGGVPPYRETQNYVEKVQARWALLEAHTATEGD